MRIVLVADEDPGWGGIGTYTGVLGGALRDLGHDVHLVLRGWEHDGAETADGLTVHRVSVPDPGWRRGTVAVASRLYVARESLLFSARAARVVGRIAPHVVEAPEFHAPGLVAALRARLDRRAPPVVARLHAPAFVTAALASSRRDLDGRVGEVLEAASARAAGSVTAPSSALAHAVCRRWRLPPRRIAVVANPVDDGLFAPAAQDAEVPGSILVVGRIEAGKGQDVLVEALPAVRAAVPGAHVRLVGADGGLADAIARRARALGVDDTVTLEGARDRADLPALYRAAAVCVVPSRFESFGYTCAEAMSCGRAVVAARAGGLSEMVSHGTSGLLVTPGDANALGVAVARLLRDPALRARIGAAARSTVLGSFAARIVAARMVAHYADVAR